MDSTVITEGTRTVTHLGIYLEELKSQSLDLASRISAAERGFYLPSEEEAIRAVLISYWQSRSALLEVIQTCRAEPKDDEDHPLVFLVAFSAALLLIDGARFLRDNFHEHLHLRRMLNLAAPEFGIPAGTYETVQQSLLQTRNAWHMYHAIEYFKQNESKLRQLANGNAFSPLLEIINRLKPRVDVSFSQYATAKLRIRTDQLIHKINRGILKRSLYGLQKIGAGMMADKYVRPGHRPNLPQGIQQQIESLIKPGDILVVRKEYAITNYFLPGYWPHVALYLGDAKARQSIGIDQHETVKSRWSQLMPQSKDSADRVLESKKDGVLIRSLSSPWESDSIVVLRPQLERRYIAEALTRGLVHEGKPYDFDFDFTRSDRLVCTEVVYRSYQGIGDIEFPLSRRAGRVTLAGRDLIAMGTRRQHFDPILVYAPSHADRLIQGPSTLQLITKLED